MLGLLVGAEIRRSQFSKISKFTIENLCANLNGSFIYFALPNKNLPSHFDFWRSLIPKSYMFFVLVFKHTNFKTLLVIFIFTKSIKPFSCKKKVYFIDKNHLNCPIYFRYLHNLVSLLVQVI